MNNDLKTCQTSETLKNLNTRRLIAYLRQRFSDFIVPKDDLMVQELVSFHELEDYVRNTLRDLCVGKYTFSYEVLCDEPNITVNLVIYGKTSEIKMTYNQVDSKLI